MKKIRRSLQIYFLRNRARKCYLAYQRVYGHLDCGNHLADHITGGRRQRLATAFNATIDRLEALGENPPKVRL